MSNLPLYKVGVQDSATGRFRWFYTKATNSEQARSLVRESLDSVGIDLRKFLVRSGELVENSPDPSPSFQYAVVSIIEGNRTRISDPMSYGQAEARLNDPDVIGMVRRTTMPRRYGDWKVEKP